MKDIKIIRFTLRNWLPWYISILVQLRKPFMARVWNIHRNKSNTVVNMFPVQIDLSKNYSNRLAEYKEERRSGCKWRGTLRYLFFKSYRREVQDDCRCYLCD